LAAELNLGFNFTAQPRAQKAGGETAAKARERRDHPLSSCANARRLGLSSKSPSFAPPPSCIKAHRDKTYRSSKTPLLSACDMYA